jgi:hypothetical protein
MEKNKFKVVSFFTIDTGYENEIKKLKKSIDKFGYDSYIEGIENQGSWDANTKYKSRLLLNSMEKNPDTELFMYVDADGIIQREIPLKEIDGDMSIHYKIRGRNGKWHKKNPTMLSGTIFYRNNDKIKNLFKIWHKLNRKNIIRAKGVYVARICDQRNLQNTINKSNIPGLKIQKLGPEYCKIFDIMDYCKDPIVEHFQASRYLKDKV